MGIDCQDSQQVHPCMLGRGIPAAHGPDTQFPPLLWKLRWDSVELFADYFRSQWGVVS